MKVLAPAKTRVFYHGAVSLCFGAEGEGEEEEELFTPPYHVAFQRKPVTGRGHSAVSFKEVFSVQLSPVLLNKPLPENK